MGRWRGHSRSTGCCPQVVRHTTVTTSIVTTIFCPHMPMQQTCIALPKSAQLALNSVAVQDHAVIGHILTQLHLHEPSPLLSQSSLADHRTVSFIQVGNSRQGCCSVVNFLGGARVAEGCLPYATLQSAHDLPRSQIPRVCCPYRTPV